PIFCGPVNDPDARDWKEYAQLCGGRFANISQDKGAVVIAAPQDKELAELSTKLNKTYVWYGKDAKVRAENQSLQDANAAKLGEGAAATRAQSKAGGLYRNADADLVDMLKKDPKFDVTKLKDDELCDELKKLKPEEREAYVKKMATEREAVQKQII